MFGKQSQIINVHEVMALVKQGEADRLKIETLTKFLNKQFDEQQTYFRNEYPVDVRTGQPTIPEKELYSFYYPFKTFNCDEYAKVAELIGFELSTDRLDRMHKDYEVAVWMNEQIRKNKGEEE